MATLTSAQKKTLDKAKKTLEKMSADLKAGKVTGLTPSTPTTSKSTGSGSSSSKTTTVSTPTVSAPVATNGSYSVKSGDTLGAIAKANNTTVDAIAKANGITNPNLIKVGQKLNIGGSSAPVSSYDVQDYRKKVAELTNPSSNPASVVWGLNLNTGYTPPNLGMANSTPSYVPPKTPPVATTPSTPTAPTTPSKPVVWGIPTPTYTPPNMGMANSTPAYPAPKTTPTTPQGGGGTSTTPTTTPKAGTTPTTTPAVPTAPVTRTTPPAGTPPVTTPAVPPTTPPVVPPTVPQTPEQVLQLQDDELARLAGEAGMSVTEYIAFMKARTEPTKEETEAIAKELGIDTLETDVFKKPKDTTDQIYQQEYKRLGLDDLKRKIEALDEDIARDRANLTEAVGTIDENPFLIETSRVGRGKRVLDQAEQTINNKLEQRKAYSDLYDQSIDEINALIKRTTDDFNVSQSVDQAKLNYLIKKAELRATQKQNTRTTASMGTYLKGRQKLKDEEAPDLVGTSETGYFRWDGTTKKYVQVIAPAPKSSNTDKDTFNPTADQKALVGRFLNTPEALTLSGGVPFTSAEIREINADPALFYAVLQKANENGIY